MRQRYRLYRRKKGGRYYIHDDVTGKQDSLHTTDRATALRLFHSRGEAQQQPAVNLQIARAYLAASDPQIATRNWQFVMEEMVKLKKGETQHRWQTAIKDKAFDLIRHLPVLETRPENFLRVLETGKVSTNVYLRRIHNFALDMTWLPWPVIVKRQWPKVEFKDKRAITWEEHQAIVTRELNPERKAFYKLAWHLGASQSDLAGLEAENIDWEHNVISFARKRPAPLPSCASMTKWRRFSVIYQGAAHYFRICARFVPAIGRRNFISASRAWASKVSACIRIGMRGRNVPKKPGIPNGSHRRRLVITARPFTAPTRVMHRWNCRR
jgi:hypothetical protein